MGLFCLNADRTPKHVRGILLAQLLFWSMVPWLAWLVLRARVTSRSGPSLRKCYLTFHIPLTSSSAIFQHCPGGTDVETYSQQLPCLAWDFFLGMCSSMAPSPAQYRPCPIAPSPACSLSPFQLQEWCWAVQPPMGRGKKLWILCQSAERCRFSWGSAGVPFSSGQFLHVLCFAFLWVSHIRASPSQEIFFGTKLRLQTLGSLSTFSQRLSLLSLGGHEGSKTSGCFILSIKQMAGKWRINQRRYWQSAVRHGDLLLQKVY